MRASKSILAAIPATIGRAWRDPMQRTLLIASVLTIAVWILMTSPPEFSGASIAPRTGSPVLDLELVETTEQARLILGDAPSTDRETMRLKTYQDFAFLACYFSVFLSAGWLVSRQRKPAWNRFAGSLIGICGFIAAIADVFENLAILALIDTPIAETTQPMLDAIRRPAMLKWSVALIGIVAGAVSTILIYRTRGTQQRRAARS